MSRRNHDVSARLLAYLTALAEGDLPCPPNAEIGVALRTGRSTIVRALDRLDDEGRIERRGVGMRRRVTIVATGARTARRVVPRAYRAPRPAPPCAVCGDPVVEKSGKFPRSCAKRSCRAAVRSLAYGGTIEDVPWPVVDDVDRADFTGQDHVFRPDVRRTGGLPFTRSYGVSSAYERTAAE